MRRCLSVLSALIVGAVIAAAQSPGGGRAEQQPAVTFRTETNFVEVHAIVTDQRGAFARDLTRDDFEIYEDGVLQKPSVFSLVDLPIERRFTPANSTAPIEADVIETSRSFEGRLYVLLLDDLHTNVTRSQPTRDLAKRFIQQYLGPRDLAAVVYTSDRQQAGQELTGNQRLLLASIDRFIGQKLPSAGVEKLAVHVQQALEQQLTNDPNEPDISGVVNGNGRTPERLDAARDINDPDELERGLRATRTLQAVKSVADWLGDVQGRRKALVLFSEGIDYDIYQPFSSGGGQSSSSIIATTQEAIAAAQRANVNIYPVDPRGLSQLGEMIDVNDKSDYPQLEYGTFRGFLHELLLAQESLMTLADQTGGIAIVNSGDIPGGLARIVLDNSRYYLLGYYSDAKRWGSKFLRIQVRTKRPGLQVRARRGFMPPDLRQAARRGREIEVKAGTSAALKAALSKPLPIGELPVRVFAAPVGGTGSMPTVLVSLEIDGSSLRFQERDGRSNESVEVSLVAIDDRGRVQGGDRQTFNLRLMPDTYQRIARTGIRLQSRLDLPPGRYQIRVGAHESTGGAVASLPYDIEVPDYSKTTFALSGVLLSSSDAGLLTTANPDPEFNRILEGPPVARRIFTAGETLRSFVEIYDRVAGAHAVSFVMTVRDAIDGRTILETRDRRDIDAGTTRQAQGFRGDVPLKGVAPGRYVLRADATSSVGGYSAQREVLFEVR